MSEPKISGDLLIHGIESLAYAMSDKKLFSDRLPIIHEIIETALASRSSPEWQPIETVPKDTDVLIYSAPVITSGVFDSDDRGGGFWIVRDGLDDWFQNCPPTHWRLLPAGPEQGVKPC